MSVVAVLGAGAGGLSAVVELSQAGHEVRLWNRRASTLEPYLAANAVRHTGVLGEGAVTPSLTTTDLSAVLRGADVAVIAVPALAHEGIFDALATVDAPPVPLVLNPGHTGGALHARAVFARRGVARPPVAELSTLTYVARTAPDALVRTTGRAKTVRAACLPGGESALQWAMALFPGVVADSDVLATSLSNVNLVLHPPGAMLSAAWTEATGGDYRFYVDAMTPAVARVLTRLDAERRSVAAAFGHELPALLDEMARVGTVDPQAAARADVVAAIRGGEANKTIKGPDSLEHRYYREDIPYGLLPFTVLAEIGGVAVETADALLKLGCLAADLDPAAGLDRVRLGLEDCGVDDLIAMVRS